MPIAVVDFSRTLLHLTLGASTSGGMVVGSGGVQDRKNTVSSEIVETSAGMTNSGGSDLTVDGICAMARYNTVASPAAPIVLMKMILIRGDTQCLLTMVDIRVWEPFSKGVCN